MHAQPALDAHIFINLSNGNLRTVLEVELGEDGADVIANSPLAQVRRLSDFPVVEPIGDELRHLAFAVGKAGKGICSRLRRRSIHA